MILYFLFFFEIFGAKILHNKIGIICREKVRFLVFQRVKNKEKVSF